MSEQSAQNPSLPSFPSEKEKTESARRAESQAKIESLATQFSTFCNHHLLAATPECDATRQTIRLLEQMGASLCRAPKRRHFSLSATSLAAEVRKCDCLGPWQLGFYYERQLVQECEFLVPREIRGDDILALSRCFEQWRQNQHALHCLVIGPVLLLNVIQYQILYAGAES